MKIFGERLRELRLDKGLSQKELAEILHVSQSVIADWERNIMETDFEMLAKIARFFDVKSDFLIGLES